MKKNCLGASPNISTTLEHSVCRPFSFFRHSTEGRSPTSSSLRGGQLSWNFIWWRHLLIRTWYNIFANGHR